MNVRVEGETLIFENFDEKFIEQHMWNAVEREEYEYWKSLKEQTDEYGIEFAEETYLEDIQNGGDEPWHLISKE